MLLDESFQEREQRHSDFMPGQFPACLLPDGTWRFGENARRIADDAWSARRNDVARSAQLWDELRSTSAQPRQTKDRHPTPDRP
jgi:hypothetical protein